LIRVGYGAIFWSMNSQYALIAGQWPELHEEALKVEQFALSDPRTACFYARRTIELLVEWVYDNDSQLERPCAAQTLADLMYARVFCDLAGEQMRRFRLLKDLGNKAVHRTDPIRVGDAVTAARELFQVLRWFALSYGRDQQRVRGCSFNADLLPSRDAATAQQAQSREQLEVLAQQLAERDTQLRDQRLAALASQAELDRLRQEITALRRANEAAARPEPDLSEFDTRRSYIDFYIEEAGWVHGQSCTHEHEVQGMPNATGTGFVDYVLWGDDGKPLALVEAKRTSRDSMEGQRQAELYANCLEQRYGQRPIIFLSNGYRHRLWDDLRYPPRGGAGFLQEGRARNPDPAPGDPPAARPGHPVKHDCGSLLPAAGDPGDLRIVGAGAPQGLAGASHRHRQDPHRHLPHRCPDPLQLGQAGAVSGGSNLARASSRTGLPSLPARLLTGQPGDKQGR
jgi:type I restriction enzyme R subunit